MRFSALQLFHNNIILSIQITLIHCKAYTFLRVWYAVCKRCVHLRFKAQFHVSLKYYIYWVIHNGIYSLLKTILYDTIKNTLFNTSLKEKFT